MEPRGETDRKQGRRGRRIGCAAGTLFLVIAGLFLGRGTLIDYLGGHSALRALDEGETLSPRARALVERCFAGLDSTRLVDYHAHLAGIGRGSDCWVNPRMQSLWHPRDHLRLAIYRSAAGVRPGDPDDAYADLLAALASREPRPPRPLLLAFDYRYDPSGKRDLEHSEFYVPNDYALALRDAHPGLFLAAASIHPYRDDAVRELERVAARGVSLIKWLPAAQGIDPADPRCDPFYAACVRLHVALLVHVGEEQAVEAEADQELGNPLRLRRPLEQGVVVIAAHCASLGENLDLDDPARPRVRAFELFMRLMGEKRFEGRLFGEISTVTQRNRYGGVLATLLERRDLHPRLVNGSDWPLPGVNVLTSTRALCAEGFLTPSERETLGEIYQWSPLLFDFCLKRVLRSPRTGQGFAGVLFEAKEGLPGY